MVFLFELNFRASDKGLRGLTTILAAPTLLGALFTCVKAERRKKMEKERIYYQECAGRLLNVYRYTAGDDEFKLDLGEIIDDPAHHCIEGDPKTTIRRVQ